MSLLDDLNAIDVTVVVDAKGLVSLALQNDDLQKLLNDGPAKSVMGELGTLLEAVEGDFSDPEAYVAPLLGAITNIAGEINFDNADINLAVDVVGDGAKILTTALGGLSGDLSQLTVGGVETIADRFSAAAVGPDDFAQKAVGALAKHRHLLEIADNGLPSDPAVIAEFALDILLPFPREILNGALSEIQALNAGLDALTLPETRLTGLIQLLVDIRIHAEAGDALALQAALDRLAALRASTMGQIGQDIRLAGQQLAGLGIGTGLTAICDILDDLRVPDLSVIDELVAWRDRIQESTGLIAQLDLDEMRTFADSLFELAETELADQFETAIDEQVLRLEAWLRELLSHLPIAELRGKITAALQQATKGIESAGLDRVATEIRTQIGNLSELVESVDLQALVDSATQALADALAVALDQIEAALGTITDQINALADQVQEVLGRATAGVAAFGDAVQSVTDLIAQIDITQAAQAVIDVLAALRETAEDLLTAVPLPDALREEVGKFTAEVAAIDVEEMVRAPLSAAIDQLQIPAEVGSTIDDGLAQIADVVANLIPDNIAAELQGELDGLFDQLESLDLSGVLGGIGEELDKLADVLQNVNIVDAMAPAATAFDQVERVIDQIKPSVLLAPVIRAYDDVIDSLPLPDPQTIAERAGETVAAVGEPAARAATAPARALADAEDQTPEPGNTPVTRANPMPQNVRPGELIRLIGYLPGKLREALDALESGPAGDVMTQIDAFCGGLARDIRRFQASLAALENRMDAEFETMFDALTTAATEAKVALHASAAVTAGPVDAQASLTLVASVDVGKLRHALAQDLAFFQAQVVRVRRSVAGPVMAKTDQVASLLEKTTLAGFGDDLDALLAAIDPSPIADEIDAIFAQVLVDIMALSGGIEADLPRYEARLRAILARFNPGAQGQKFLRALNVLKEQFDLINPRRLADELDEVHKAIKDVIASYDPAVFAADLQALVGQVELTLRSLDPANLAPDFAPVEAQIARVPALLPIAALEGVGTQLDALSAEIEAIDITALLDSVNTLTPQITDAVELTAEGIKAEILALLGAIQYAETNASATATLDSGGLSGGISL